MIEIGPNLKESLSNIVYDIAAIAMVLGPLYIFYLIVRSSDESKKPQYKRTFFSMDNPIIYLIISLLVFLILTYVFKIK